MEYTPFEEAIMKAQAFAVNLLIYTQVCGLIEKQSECTIGLEDSWLNPGLRAMALQEAVEAGQALITVAGLRESAGISA